MDDKEFIQLFISVVVGALAEIWIADTFGTREFLMDKFGIPTSVSKALLLFALIFFILIVLDRIIALSHSKV